MSTYFHKKSGKVLKESAKHLSPLHLCRFQRVSLFLTRYFVQVALFVCHSGSRSTHGREHVKSYEKLHVPRMASCAINIWIFQDFFITKSVTFHPKKGESATKDKTGISREKAVMLTPMGDGIVLLCFLLTKH